MNSFSSGSLHLKNCLSLISYSQFFSHHPQSSQFLSFKKSKIKANGISSLTASSNSFNGNLLKPIFTKKMNGYKLYLLTDQMKRLGFILYSYSFHSFHSFSFKKSLVSYRHVISSSRRLIHLNLLSSKLFKYSANESHTSLEEESKNLFSLTQEEKHLCEIIGLSQVPVPYVIQMLTDASLTHCPNNERLVFMGKLVLEKEHILRTQNDILSRKKSLRSDSNYSDTQTSASLTESGELNLGLDKIYSSYEIIYQKAIDDLIRKWQLHLVSRYDLEKPKLALTAYRNAFYSIIGTVYYQKGSKETSSFLEKHLFTTIE